MKATLTLTVKVHPPAKLSPTAVRFWDVGATTDTALQMSSADMEAHLAADWLPGLVPLGGSSLVSWPSRLMVSYSEPKTAQRYLRILRRAAWSDSQWNGVLSWMVGVCGARQVLSKGGYTFVAPLSAFYRHKKKQVNIDPSWPSQLLPGKLVVSPDPANPSRLMPDYLALRCGAGPDDWHLALVEAKGTKGALQNLATCPPKWHSQVRNALVQFEGTPIAPDRHLVVATRCAPGMKREKTTVLQVRAWNQEQGIMKAPAGLAMEAATAALLGVCQSLGLDANATCLVAAHRLRHASAAEKLASVDAQQALEQAAVAELQSSGDCHPIDASPGWTAAHLVVPGLPRRHRLVLLPATVALLRLLSLPEPYDSLKVRFHKRTRELQRALLEPPEIVDGGALVPPGIVLN